MKDLSRDYPLTLECQLLMYVYRYNNKHCSGEEDTCGYLPLVLLRLESKNVGVLCSRDELEGGETSIMV